MLSKPSAVITASWWSTSPLGWRVSVCPGFRTERQDAAPLAHQLMTSEQHKRDIVRTRVETAEARLEGLRADDPYVIELIARERTRLHE